MRSKENWIVMRSVGFIPPRKVTEQPATLSSVMANRTTEFCHSDGVRKCKEEEEKRGENLAVMQVIYAQTFLLDH
jgi:hypothetical protein